MHQNLLLALSALLATTYAAPAPAAGFLSGAAAIQDGTTPIASKRLADFIGPPDAQYQQLEKLALPDTAIPAPDFGDAKVGDIVKAETPVSATTPPFPVSAPPTTVYALEPGKHLILFFSTADAPKSEKNSSDPLYAGTAATTFVIDRYIRDLPQPDRLPLTQFGFSSWAVDGIATYIGIQPNSAANKASCDVQFMIQGLMFWRSMVVQNNPRRVMHWMILDEATETSCTFYSFLL